MIKTFAPAALIASLLFTAVSAYAETSPEESAANEAIPAENITLTSEMDHVEALRFPFQSEKEDAAKRCESLNGVYEVYTTPGGHKGICAFGEARISSLTLTRFSPLHPQTAITQFANHPEKTETSQTTLRDQARVFCQEVAQGDIVQLNSVQNHDGKRELSSLELCHFSNDESLIEIITLFKGHTAPENAGLTQALGVSHVSLN
jgi:hypothetical protein